MSPMQAVVIHCSIGRPAAAVYNMLWRPEDFPRWASGLSDAGLAQDGNAWKAQGPGGPVRIRFTPRNAFGVMDHWVHLADGQVVHVPMRIVPNGDGSEVMFTLYRQPGMSEADFLRDQDWVRRDLQALKRLAEG